MEKEGKTVLMKGKKTNKGTKERRQRKKQKNFNSWRCGGGEVEERDEVK